MNLSFSQIKLSRGHQRIADYISKNIEQIPFLIEEDIAQACQVSISTVSRFWSEIGCKNLKEFKQRAKEEALFSPAGKLRSAFDKLDERQDASANVLAAAAFLEQTAGHLDQSDFDQAVLLLGAAAAVHLYGAGSAESLCALMDFRLTRLGLRVNRLDRGGHELFDKLVHVNEHDVIVIFGFVAQSPELAVLFDFARSKGCKTILITDLLVSDMVDKADASLYTARGELWEFHSMVASIAVIETLIVAVGKSREQEALPVSQRLQQLRLQYQNLLPKRL